MRAKADKNVCPTKLDQVGAVRGQVHMAAIFFLTSQVAVGLGVSLDWAVGWRRSFSKWGRMDSGRNLVSWA
jgi:hypothetical protein